MGYESIFALLAIWMNCTFCFHKPLYSALQYPVPGLLSRGDTVEMTSNNSLLSVHHRVSMTTQKEPPEELSARGKSTGPNSWSRVSCPCCISSHVEPLVLIQLSENVQPITKQWIMSMISAPVKTGGGTTIYIYTLLMFFLVLGPVGCQTFRNYNNNNNNILF